MAIDYSKFLNNTKSNTSKINYSKLGYTPKTIDYSKFTKSTSINTENLKNIPTINVNTQTANSTPSIVRNPVFEAPLTKEATSDKNSPLVSKYGFKGKSQMDINVEDAKKSFEKAPAYLKGLLLASGTTPEKIAEQAQLAQSKGKLYQLGQALQYALPTPTVVPGEGAMLSKAGELLSEKKPIIEEIPPTDIPPTKTTLKSSVEPQIAPETPINQKLQNTSIMPENNITEPIKPIEPATESVINKTLFNGSNKVIKEENKTFNKVLTFDNSQRDVISQLAQNGNKEAQAIIDNPTNFYHEADNLIRKEYGNQYDAIQYKNLDRPPQVGVEYHDLKTDTHWAENKDYAESYSLQNRGLGVQAQETPVETFTPKISKSIETKAIEAGVPKETFNNLPEVEKIHLKEQMSKATDFINNDIEQARKVVRGEAPLPGNVNATQFIAGMEEYIKKYHNSDMAYELANSNLTKASSLAGQEIVSAKLREPDSFTAKIIEIKKAKENSKIPDFDKKIAEGKKSLAKEVIKNNLPKEDLIWNKFLETIACR